MREWWDWLDTVTVPLWVPLLLTVIGLIVARLIARKMQAWREARCRRDGHVWMEVSDDEVWCRRCHYSTARIHRGGRRGR